MRAQIHEFFARGGGVHARLPENSSDNVFFLSPQLILQFYSGLLMVCFKANYIFSKFQRGSNVFRGGGGCIIFQGGSNFFQGGGGGLNANLYRNP